MERLTFKIIQTVKREIVKHNRRANDPGSEDSVQVNLLIVYQVARSYFH